MENPLDTSATAGESLAQTIQRLTERVASLERTRTVPALIEGGAYAAIKAQLPAKAKGNTIIVGRANGTEKAMFLFIYNEAASAWYEITGVLA